MKGTITRSFSSKKHFYALKNVASTFREQALVEMKGETDKWYTMFDRKT